MAKLEKIPLELAIEAVETCTEPGSEVGYEDYLRAFSSSAGDIGYARSWLDHTIQLLIRGGYLRRVHLAPGELRYQATEAWKDRDTILATLRSPKPVVRAWRIRLAEARRAERLERKRQREEARMRAREEEKRRKQEERRRRLEERRRQMIAERGLTPSGLIRRRSRAESMKAKGLPLMPQGHQPRLS